MQHGPEHANEFEWFKPQEHRGPKPTLQVEGKDSSTQHSSVAWCSAWSAQRRSRLISDGLSPSQAAQGTSANRERSLSMHEANGDGLETSWKDLAVILAKVPCALAEA
jgi:hypothetical protein